MALRHSERYSGGGLECLSREDRLYHDAKTKKRWPIRCRKCRHKAAVWMTRNQLNLSTFRCSKCNSRDVAKAI